MGRHRGQPYPFTANRKPAEPTRKTGPQLTIIRPSTADARHRLVYWSQIIDHLTTGALTMAHRSRLCHFVIDCDDLDRAVEFWSAALDAAEEPISEKSRPIYRRLRLPDSHIRILLQHTNDMKASKERMHLDVETDDVFAEVERLKALGASLWDHQQERGHDFWVMRDPWGNELCVLAPEFPDLLARRRTWTGVAGR